MEHSGERQILLSVKESAARLKVSEYSVREWLKSGTLRGYKVGERLWRIPEEAILEFMSLKQQPGV